MKTILNLISIATLVLLFAPALFAGDGVEVSAEWEVTAGSSLWDELVVTGVTSGEKIDFSPNSFCSSFAFEQVETYKKNLYSLISNEKNFSSAVYSTAAEAVTRLAVILTSSEIDRLNCLIGDKLSSAIAATRSSEPIHSSPGKLPSEERVVTGTFAAATFSRVHMKQESSGIKVLSSGNENLPVIPFGYLWDTHKIDFFSLVLYQWEDSPRGDLYYTFGSSSRFTFKHIISTTASDSKTRQLKQDYLDFLINYGVIS